MTILTRITIATLIASATLPHAALAQPAPTAPAPDPAGPPAPAGPTQPPAPPPAAAVPGVPKGPEWTTLRLLHDKGVISDAELASALSDLAIVGAGDATTLVLAKLKTTIYGN